MLLAYDAIEGTSIDSITEYDDDLLDQIWQQVAILRRERIAHRDLRRANIFRGTDGELWIIDFGFSELAASDQLLRADVAELLAATAIVVGPERAVRAAVGALGKEPVGDSLAMLQPLALAGATHKAMAEQKGLMAGLQAEVRAQTGVTDVQLEPLARVRPRTVLILVSSLIALYVLIPQLTDVGGMVRQLRHASWGWVAATLLFSFLSYIGASISLMGLAPTHVPAFDAFEVCLSGSFVNRITPAGVGGIGLNVRYLQKRGADTAVAASRIGVNSVLGVVIHLTLTLLFVLWAGKEASFDFRLPKMPLLVGAAGAPRRGRCGLPGAVGPRAPAGLGPPGARPGLVGRHHDRQAAVAPARHDHRRHLDHPRLPVRPLLRGGGLRRAAWPSRPSARSTWPARPSARRRRRPAAWARSRPR